MRILVIGASGLVGSRFLELYSTPSDLVTPTHQELDITNPSQVKGFIVRTKPEIIINFAAYTNVGEAENQRDNQDGDCRKINVDGVKNLVSSLQPDHSHFIHISTDMVFTGLPEDPGPYPENHPAETNRSKLTWYGFTKAEGERIITRQLGNKATILRLIYPVRANYPRKLDYLRKPLKLFDESKLYPMFTNQQVSISFVDEVVTAIEKIITSKSMGTFHASCPDTTSPFELYSYLILKARGIKGAVAKGDIDEFLKTASNPTRYPKFGGLKVEETKKKLGIKFSPWKQIIDKIVEQGIS